MSSDIPARLESVSALRREELTSADIRILGWLALAFLLTRAGNLGRELVPEEGIFLAPGIALLHTGEFDLFHKPPLTSLLLGLGSTLGHDPIAGARLVPFLVGMFVCLYPFLLTRSVVPSIIVLLSPFLFAASAHMQTDPTVGLLGYTLVSGGILHWARDSERAMKRTLVAGLVVLWLGKLEIAVIATAVLIAIRFLLPRRRLRLLRVSLIATAAGIVLFFLVTALLGFSADRSVSHSVGEVVHTVARISSELAAGSSALTGDAPRLKIFHLLGEVLMPELLILTVTPIFYFGWRLPRGSELRIALAALLLAAVLPMAVYLFGGYPGDGFPRYFLIVIPPLLLALGICVHAVDPPSRRSWNAVLILSSMLLLAPETYLLWKYPGSVTVHRNVYGYRDAALFAGSLTRPGDLILAPEAATHYVTQRRWIVVEEIEPYPSRHDNARSQSNQIAAAIVPRRSPQNRQSGIVGELVTGIESRGARIFRFGTVDVIVERAALDRSGGNRP